MKYYHYARLIFHINILEDEVDNLQDLRGLSIDNISQLVLVGGAIYLGANLLN